MLGLMELYDVICQWLSRHDLTQCAQVSKKWHSSVTPHLWHDFSWISSRSSSKSIKAFYDMVLEDYLDEQRHQKLLKKENDMEEPSQARLSPPSSTLLKYGHWIQTLPAPGNLERVFRLSTPAGINKGPTPHELILHLFKRCSPQVKVPFMSVDLYELDLDPEDPKKMVLDFTLPRLRHLSVRGDIESSSETQDLLDFLGLLDHHAITLEVLTLNVDFSNAGMICIQEDQARERSNGWASLRKLFLYRFSGSNNTNAFLSWLLKRCCSVKGLIVKDYSGSAQSLVEGMSAHLPNLSEIILGDGSFGMDCMGDDMMAQFLSGSGNGWKFARFCSKSSFGDDVMDALTRHISSLEDEYETVTSDQSVQVLRSRSRLHTLSTTYWYHGINLHDSINAGVFADVDPDTASFRPWQCEKSLEVLQARITSISRPQAYAGQTEAVHDQVYDRLTRLANLETWWLGDQGSCHRLDCMELSLESGLDKLSGLSKLKELGVTGMDTRIGIRELHWMTEHWSRLRTVYGLRDKETKKH
ncbi:MAG: hypothetical protein J3Q66DRAFT_350784 [Benniella sp.]|nr:MAG: hypothetical protein J3Q66DRAFT_350784 [Benniella sp.]